MNIRIECGGESLERHLHCVSIGTTTDVCQESFLLIDSIEKKPTNKFSFRCKMFFFKKKKTIEWMPCSTSKANATVTAAACAAVAV